MTAPRIVGCDVSLTSLGIATRHHAAVLTSTGHRGDTLTQRRERLGCLRRSVLDWTTDADLVVIEAPSYGSVGAGTHDRAGLWWLIVSALLHRGVPVVEVAPATVKRYATGRGNASKDEVLTAAVRRLPQDVDNNNGADAAWLAAIGHALLGDPLVTLPANHRAALDVLRPQLEGNVA